MSLLNDPVQHHDETIEERDKGEDDCIGRRDDEILVFDEGCYLFPAPEKQEAAADKGKDADDVPNE